MLTLWCCHFSDGSLCRTQTGLITAGKDGAKAPNDHQPTICSTLQALLSKHKCIKDKNNLHCNIAWGIKFELLDLTHHGRMSIKEKQFKGGFRRGLEAQHWFSLFTRFQCISLLLLHSLTGGGPARIFSITAKPLSTTLPNLLLFACSCFV